MIILIPAEPQPLPRLGQAVVQHLDWSRRHSHMRVHTALHLLSVVIPLPVSGGAIAEGRGRLDFDMPEAPADPGALEAALNALIARDLAVNEEWITEAALDANPGLVKTLSVQPPRGAGQIRLVRIADGAENRRSAALRRHPCGAHRRNRPGGPWPDREEGQAEPPRAAAVALTAKQVLALRHPLG